MFELSIEIPLYMRSGQPRTIPGVSQSERDPGVRRGHEPGPDLRPLLPRGGGKEWPGLKNVSGDERQPERRARAVEVRVPELGIPREEKGRKGFWARREELEGGQLDQGDGKKEEMREGQ